MNKDSETKATVKSVPKAKAKAKPKATASKGRKKKA
jgi:hypothetical protein